MPARLAASAGPALPLAELAVAVALVIRPSARWGAPGALLLLPVFIAGVARAMSQGRTPDCHCFGQLHSEPAGRSTLIRNAAPAAAGRSSIVAAGTRPEPGRRLSVASTARRLLWWRHRCWRLLLALAVAQLWGDRRRLVASSHSRSTAAGARPGSPAAPRRLISRLPPSAVQPAR